MCLPADPVNSPEPAFLICLSMFSFQLKEKVLQRQQGSYILTVEAGRQLLLSADNQAEVALQVELTDIQEQWKHTSIRLDKQKKELTTLLKVRFAGSSSSTWILYPFYNLFVKLDTKHSVKIYCKDPAATIVCVMYRTGRDAREALVDH